MKKLFKPIAVLFCLGGIISSCSKQVSQVPVDPVAVFPLASFTVTPDPLDGFTYKFTNTSAKYKSIEMRFGDDSLKTDANITHTYLNTGDPAKAYKYTVDLKAISETGDISHKYVDLAVVADSIIQFNAVRIASTSTTGTVKFTANVKATVKSYLWTFTDNKTSTPVITTSTLASPEVVFQIGSFNGFKLTIVTDKGSTATLSRSVTVDGIATDITASYINKLPLYPAYQLTTVENTAQGANEGASKMFDGNLTTKFGYYSSFPVPLILTLQFPAPVLVKSYGWMNGNDSGTSRDPKQWIIEGANSASGPWDELDNVTLTKGFYDMGTDLGLTGNGPSGIDVRYRKWWYYPLKTTGLYSFYRIRVVQTFGGAFQMTEIAFFK
ncbi:MAG: hypothetical protein H7289_10535 [Mucilaginibacter sp.]|nr:hypothetical protein [Mucilaginibacter sp.]